LSDILVSSAIVAGEDGAAPAFVSSGGGSYEFGVDPNLDPELALALRISLEEERARQEAASGGAPKAEEGAAKAEGGAAAAAGAGSAAGGIEDDLLAQALASSQADVRLMLLLKIVYKFIAAGFYMLNTPLTVPN
jgi:26S proteasome regulatory subunit N10